MKIIVAAAEFCRCDQSHEFKPVWIRATYRSDKISESSVVASCLHFRQQVAATKYKWTNERASYGQPYWIRKLVHIPPHTRSLRVHRRGVVSQRLVLQVVHMEQLVAETCRCDLSPSVSRPLHNIASVLINFFFSLGFARFFARISYFLNFWSLRNFITQLFHSRLLDTRLVIANSTLRASLAIYRLTSNARSWNNNYY